MAALKKSGRAFIRIGESVTQGRIPGQLLSGVLDFRIFEI